MDQLHQIRSSTADMGQMSLWKKRILYQIKIDLQSNSKIN